MKKTSAKRAQRTEQLMYLSRNGTKKKVANELIIFGHNVCPVF